METQRYITVRQYATLIGASLQVVHQRLMRAGITLSIIDGAKMIDTKIFLVSIVGNTQKGRAKGTKNKVQLTAEEKKERNRINMQKYREKQKIK